jgi:hypothetical protein
MSPYEFCQDFWFYEGRKLIVHPQPFVPWEAMTYLNYAETVRTLLSIELAALRSWS